MSKLNNEWQAKGVEVTCNGRMVATTFGGDLYKHCTDFDAQQAFDHAKLIAAAPELYEALKSALELLEYNAVDINGEWGAGRSLEQIELEGDLNEEIIKAREALAKARGGL